MNFVLDHIKDPTELDEIDNEYGISLRFAVEENIPDCVKILLARGANPDTRFKTRTPRDAVGQSGYGNWP
jgi:hypothetical protein